MTLLPLLPQVILEEFGKFINATVGADMNQRNQYYGIIFDEINKLTDAGKPIKVSLLSSSISACARVRACVRSCVRACVRVCVCALQRLHGICASVLHNQQMFTAWNAS